MMPPAAINLKYVSLLWASPEQAGEIARLHAQLFSPGWPEESIRSLLDHPGSTAFLATYGPPPKVTLGFVMAQLAFDEAEILTLGVAPDYQRNGVGQWLVEGVARAVKRAEAKQLFLEVAADNDAALKLYNRAGFLGTGLRKGYYERPGEQAVDAITLALKL